MQLENSGTVRFARWAVLLLAVLLVGAAGVATNFFPKADVVLARANNVRQAFTPSANTDAARGAAFLQAIAAAQANDVILLGPGTYAVGTTRIEASVPVTVRGMGPTHTHVTSTRRSDAGGDGGPCWRVSDGLRIQNLSIDGVATTGFQYPFGWDEEDDGPNTTNKSCWLDTVDINADSDCLYVYNNNWNPGLIKIHASNINCTSKYDTCLLSGYGAWLEIRDFTFRSSGSSQTGANQKRGFWLSGARLYAQGGRVEITGAGGASDTYGLLFRNDPLMFVSDVDFTTATGDSVADIYRESGSGGVLNIDVASTGSGTSGLLIELGSAGTVHHVSSISALDADLTSIASSTALASWGSYLGAPVYKRAYSDDLNQSTESSGVTTLYTTPSGKRGIWNGRWTLTAPSGTATTYPAILIGGTAYRIGTSVNSSSTFTTGDKPIVLEAGESLAIVQTTNIDAIKVRCRIVEVDAASCPFRSIKAVTASGSINTGAENVVYTVPTDKMFVPTDSSLLPTPGNVSNQNLWTTNGTDATITALTWLINGKSCGVQVSAGASQTFGTTTAVPVLVEGDTFGYQPTNVGTGFMVTWMNGLELDEN